MIKIKTKTPATLFYVEMPKEGGPTMISVKNLGALMLVCLVVVGVGCTKQQTGVASGTAVGAAVGGGLGYAVSGGSVAGTAIGVGAGAVAGALAGQKLTEDDSKDEKK